MPRWSHDDYSASPCWPTCKKTCEVVCKTMQNYQFTSSQDDMRWHVVFSLHWGEEAIGDRTPHLWLNAGWWVRGSAFCCSWFRHHAVETCCEHMKPELSHGLQDEAKQVWFKPALSKERHAIRSTSPRTPFTIRRRKSGHCKGLWIKPVDMSVGAHEAIRSWAMGHEVKGSILAITSVGRLPAMNMHPG